MCLSIPGKIIEMKGEDVVVDYGAEKRQAKNYIGAKLGEWVIISNRIIVMRIPKKEAEEFSRLLK